jgi:hypothetical protein
MIDTLECKTTFSSKARQSLKKMILYCYFRLFINYFCCVGEMPEWLNGTVLLTESCGKTVVRATSIPRSRRDHPYSIPEIPQWEFLHRKPESHLSVLVLIVIAGFIVTLKFKKMNSAFVILGGSALGYLLSQL